MTGMSIDAKLIMSLLCITVAIEDLHKKAHAFEEEIKKLKASNEDLEVWKQNVERKLENEQIHTRYK